MFTQTKKINKENSKDRLLQRKTEIFHWQKQLEVYGIHFIEIVENVPKDKETRKELIHIAQMIAKNETLKTKMLSESRLPVSEIMEYAGHYHFILKHQFYLTALILLYTGDYSNLTTSMTLTFDPK